MIAEPWSREEFLIRLQDGHAPSTSFVGSKVIIIYIRFKIRMNAGDLDRSSIQLWVANRFYYQRNLPRKDASILANCPEHDIRRKWIKRIIDMMALRNTKAE
jgi:hypothetical protein